MNDSSIKVSVDATPTTLPDPGKLNKYKFKNFIATLATSHEETRNKQICNWIEDSRYENGGYNDCHYEDVTGQFMKKQIILKKYIQY